MSRVNSFTEVAWGPPNLTPMVKRMERNLRSRMRDDLPPRSWRGA